MFPSTLAEAKDGVPSAHILVVFMAGKVTNNPPIQVQLQAEEVDKAVWLTTQQVREIIGSVDRKQPLPGDFVAADGTKVPAAELSKIYALGADGKGSGIGPAHFHAMKTILQANQAL